MKSTTMIVLFLTAVSFGLLFFIEFYSRSQARANENQKSVTPGKNDDAAA
jgi:hypothetical protein